MSAEDRQQLVYVIRSRQNIEELIEQEKYIHAANLCGKSLAICRRLRGADHPDTADCLLTLGLLT